MGVFVKLIIATILLGIFYFIYDKISKNKITNDNKSNQQKASKSKEVINSIL